MDQKRFEEAKRKIIGVDRQRLGIGTLSEKTVHAIFKDYYEPDEDHQEIPIENYVADIYKDGEIIEIQTRQFNRMRGKLQAFLPLYPVTIVYPIPYEKWLIWIDEDSGELSKKRKSPKKGSTYQAFKELYKIKMFLKDPNIRFKFVLVNMEEYRLLNGWSHDKKKGSTRYDRIPVGHLFMDDGNERIGLHCFGYGSGKADAALNESEALSEAFGRVLMDLPETDPLAPFLVNTAQPSLNEYNARLNEVYSGRADNTASPPHGPC